MRNALEEFARSFFQGRKQGDLATSKNVAGNARSTMEAFASSGLFDPTWYLASYPDLVNTKVGPQDHYMMSGWREGRMPNPVFDSSWYLKKYPDVAASGMNPLLHYWLYGERENRHPAAYFDTVWYKSTYASDFQTSCALAHFLRNRHSKKYSPNRYFDIEYYLKTYPDIAAANIDPFEHFTKTGYLEGRNPSAAFDTTYYMRRFMHGDLRDPLSHYMEFGHSLGAATNPASAPASAASEIKRFSKNGVDFEELRRFSAPRDRQGSKIVAFHLPQFHSIPENDRWWGKGFSEWTNASRGTPRFEGHYQPRIPRDLGFYDLSEVTTLERQVTLAKAAGLHAFCFYYYNFNGKRLLERPIENFLSTPGIDFPFCLMWANENWTRRWDGAESEVLITQDYRRQDTDTIIDDLARHFEDKRYLRIEGRPLFILYRPDVVPDTTNTLSLWRDRFQRIHNMDPIILMVQAFGNVDPREHGFDGAIEFPPHKLTAQLSTTNSNRRYFDAEASAQVFTYDDVVDSSLGESAPNFPLIKTAVPGWDNDARRQGHGLVIADSTPSKYEAWLNGLIEYSKQNTFFGESFVFVNAWNEWAEGAYLEPDVYFGGAYLNATARAIAGVASQKERFRVLLVGHDAHPHGAQMLLINLAKRLKFQFGIEVEVVLCSGGDMDSDYQSVAPTTICSSPEQLQQKFTGLRQRGFGLAITNTVATGRTVPILKKCGFRVLSLIHELPKIIDEKSLTNQATHIADQSDELVFPAEYVRKQFEKAIGSPKGIESIRPQGIYNEVSWISGARESVRKEFNLPSDAKLVVNIGYADLRKGVDIFCNASRLVQAADPSAKFLWVGNVDPAVKNWFEDRNAYSNVIFAGQRRDVDRLLSAADVFALTSREDPYPSVVLEAISLKLPVVGFEDAGGFSELLQRSDFGELASFGDTNSISEAVVSQLNRKLNGTTISTAMQAEFKRRFAFDDYSFWLASRLQPGLKKISVIVPNFNYEKYLRDRLNTIFSQSYPVFEVIVLDDNSTDKSLEVIRKVQEETGRLITLLENRRNSGNVFSQWSKGLEAARGDFVWIAEADDLADPDFLSRLVNVFDSEKIGFAFCDSVPIDSEGIRLDSGYKSYYSKISLDALQTDMQCDGPSFASNYLSQRNAILNVSSVLWRKNCLLQAFASVREILPTFKLAGDWLLYLAACTHGDVGYLSVPANYHRRHQRGVTSMTVPEMQLEEVKRIHQFFGREFGGEHESLQEAYLRELTEQFGERHHQ